MSLCPYVPIMRFVLLLVHMFSLAVLIVSLFFLSHPVRSNRRLIACLRASSPSPSSSSCVTVRLLSCFRWYFSGGVREGGGGPGGGGAAEEIPAVARRGSALASKVRRRFARKSKRIGANGTKLLKRKPLLGIATQTEPNCDTDRTRVGSLVACGYRFTERFVSACRVWTGVMPSRSSIARNSQSTSRCITIYPPITTW